MNKVEIHKSICDNMNKTYEAKNADYGDSFAKVREEYPEAICIRLMDKLERLKQLVGGSVQQVKDESIEDTLLDMANYCVMEIVERRVGKLTECEGVCLVPKDDKVFAVKQDEATSVLCHVRDCHLNVLGFCAINGRDCKNGIADRG